MTIAPADHVGFAVSAACRSGRTAPDEVAVLSPLGAARRFDPTKGTWATYASASIALAVRGEVARQFDEPRPLPLFVTSENGEEIERRDLPHVQPADGARLRALELRAVIEWMFANQRDRRNLTPDQLALVMGRHRRAQKVTHGFVAGGWNPRRKSQNERAVTERVDEKIAKDYGVSPATVRRNMAFAAAVDTLRAVDPDIEAKVVTGKGPTRKRSSNGGHSGV